MKKIGTLLVLLLALAVLLGGAYALYGRLRHEAPPDQLAVQQEPRTQDGPQAQEAEKGGEAPPERVPAPDFTVYDQDQNPVRLSDFAGKPVVLNFWASWCGPCQSEMPDFDEAFGELGEEVQFLMVNMTSGSESLESASSFIDDQGYTFPVFYDLDGAAAAAYGIYALPTTLFIDAEGYAVAQAAGAIGRETLETGIGMIAEP